MKISDAWQVSPSERPRYDTPPRIDVDCLVIGDAQVPFHDAEFINRCKHVAFAFGIKTCIWGADMVDFHALAQWVSHDEERSLEHELAEGQKHLDEIAAGFDEVHWIRGNHENRIVNALGRWLPTERIAMMLGTGAHVKAYDYYWMQVGDDWLIEHPYNASVIPARVAAWLAEKYNRNVITFHGHTLGEAQTRGGQRIGIDCGVSCDPEKLAYQTMRHNTRTAMMRGAVILRRGNDNVFYKIHLDEWVDFDLLAGMGEQCQRQKQYVEIGEAKQNASKPLKSRR